MAILEKSLGKNVDWPQLEITSFAAAAGGTGADPTFDTTALIVPNMGLRIGANAVQQADQYALAKNRVELGQIALSAQAASNTLGNATNNCTLYAKAWRAGVLQGIVAYYPLSIATTLNGAVAAGATSATLTSATGVVVGMALGVDSGTSFEVVYVQAVSGNVITANFTKAHNSAVAVTTVLVPNLPITMISATGPANTTASTAIAPGSVTVTPASMYGIHVGDYLVVDTGTPQEVVQVTAVTMTTFTATFANSHSGTYAITTAVDVYGKARLANGMRYELQPTDTIGMTRVSNNATGLATPLTAVLVEWLPAGIHQ
jgi:hypothetical protein